MKKAVIIGATSGIGRELAKVLSADGYTLAVSSILDRVFLFSDSVTSNWSPKNYFTADTYIYGNSVYLTPNGKTLAVGNSNEGGDFGGVGQRDVGTTYTTPGSGAVYLY